MQALAFSQDRKTSSLSSDNTAKYALSIKLFSSFCPTRRQNFLPGYHILNDTALLFFQTAFCSPTQTGCPLVSCTQMPESERSPLTGIYSHKELHMLFTLRQCFKGFSKAVLTYISYIHLQPQSFAPFLTTAVSLRQVSLASISQEVEL